MTVAFGSAAAARSCCPVGAVDCCCVEAKVGVAGVTAMTAVVAVVLAFFSIVKSLSPYFIFLERLRVKSFVYISPPTMSAVLGVNQGPTPQCPRVPAKDSQKATEILRKGRVSNGRGR
jgi:hypothetical protein